jgi:hypothetical protein
MNTHDFMDDYIKDKYYKSDITTKINSLPPLPPGEDVPKGEREKTIKFPPSSGLRPPSP